MKPSADFLLRNWRALITPALVLTVVLVAGWLVQRILFRRLQTWSARTTTRLDDIVIGAVQGPFMVWVLILALQLAAQSSDLPARVTGLVSQSLLILWIVSLTLVAARLSGAMVRHYGSTVAGAQPVTTITQNLAGIAVVTIGLLILLNTLGISITPILTALGVGGLAVALALQDTLSNLFAGFYITVAGQVRAGDYIKLSTGEEGYVSDISWRSTTMRALPNNLIVVPNAKLAQAIVTNYHLPEKRMSLLIAIGVSYDCDPDVVEKVLVEEATAGADEIPGLLADPAPFVRFIPGFGDFSLNFTLICQVSEFVDQYLVQHELRKRIFRRFRKQGIEIPFPIQTIKMSGGNHQDRPQGTSENKPGTQGSGQAVDSQ